MSSLLTLVTGANGFVGSAVTRALARHGERVRVLLRPGADDRNLSGLDVERVYGDVTDPDSVRRAIAGCARIYHVAARYSLRSREARELYRCNVIGTRNVLELAREAEVERAVYTSSVGVLGRPADRPGDEDSPVTLADMVGHYKHSKFLAEQEAIAQQARGLRLVTVYPSTPIGQGDVKPTPTGQVIVDFLKGRIPAYLDTGLNYVSVEDVAEGHLLAMERGQHGGRYILGCRNLAFREFLALVADLTGRRAPEWRIPYPLAWLAGAGSETWSRVTGRPPTAPLDGVRMARKSMYFDASRAVRELGLPQTPIEHAIEQAVRWFVDHGYLERGTLLGEPSPARMGDPS
jgi:dihydroflavonol-4-reductase